ncbi:USP50 isoform 4 [Pan troglodytes]|uniref:USP50 isoform 4 n=1 Tax=Pan troglodytes TaxID=9598 RepID=A0A2J8NSZ4_PANTR|nr:USP50 isoform 4 [Pan troglodytes]
MTSQPSLPADDFGIYHVLTTTPGEDHMRKDLLRDAAGSGLPLRHPSSPSCLKSSSIIASYV